MIKKTDTSTTDHRSAIGSAHSSRGIFLTGATGFVGQYLLKEAAQTGTSLAVLVRSEDRTTAQQRIEGIIQNWEERLRRRLIRPVVIEGSLNEPGLGLSRADRNWLQRKCTAVLHSAASVSFETGDQDSEPWLTNVEGTRGLIELCGEIGLREFHHVSTAYVCGLRTGRILETDLERQPQFGNDYERSKFEAEGLLREARPLGLKTVYRPSIVVGDSETGHATTFRGIYGPLQLIYLYALSNPRRELPLLNTVGLTGDESKNLVPVDWVARVIWRLMRSPSSAGRTFHLTNPAPTRIQSIMDAVEGVVQIDLKDEECSIGAASLFKDGRFRKNLDVYNTYLRSDPDFDCSQTAAAVPDDPCPSMSHDQLMRIAAYAIEQRFAAPRARAATAPSIEQLMRSAMSEFSESTIDPDDWLQLELVGPGGGAWQIGFRNANPVSLDRGKSDSSTASAYCAAETFQSLIESNNGLLDAVSRGRLVLYGRNRPVDECLQLLTMLQRKLAKTCEVSR